MVSLHTLTAYELALVADPQILLTKNVIIRKVSGLFTDLTESYTTIAVPLLPENVLRIPPKISKGEQYLGLPYVVLDYPRLFSKEHTFAIRTFFWWGNFFSIHLQLSGQFQPEYAVSLQKQLTLGNLNGWYIGVHESAWHHHFEPDNYSRIASHLQHSSLTEAPFIKLAKKIPLSEWDNVQNILTTYFKQLLTMLIT
jgi:hypothetical protein